MQANPPSFERDAAAVDLARSGTTAQAERFVELIGVDFRKRYPQCCRTLGTIGNVNDVTQAHALVHGEETDVFANAGYQGVGKREETQDINVNWHVAM